MSKPSLIPYLDSRAGKCRLTFFPDGGLKEITGTGYRTISDSAPFTSIVKAEFVTDYPSTIRDVYALIQKDRYDFPVSDIYPVGNKDIDALWQRAYSIYAGGEGRRAPILLANQLDAGGRFQPFHSLFLCRKRGVFFHPPCPACGEALEQCERDDLLVRSGLHPYSTSRFRYLFCPTCAADEGKALFYGYETQGGRFPYLKNRLELIAAFEALTESGHHSDALPCFDCPEVQQCYGPGREWSEKIEPFSFFPFYMMLFSGGLINAFDFFSLSAGAGSGEIKQALTEKGRRNQAQCLDDFKGQIGEASGLLDGTGRFFLEVLFLKLDFLQTLFRTLFSEENLEHYPLLGPDLDRIWVRPSRSSHGLPFFWNFDVAIMDFGPAAVYPSLVHKPPISSAAGHMGLMWFYLLLANNRHTTKEIYECLAEAVGLEKSCEAPWGNGFDSVFAPENIFWNPDAHRVDSKWHDVWRRALSMGWRVFCMGFTHDGTFDAADFGSQLRDFRDAVRIKMFADTEGGVQTEVEDVRNAAIYRILSRLKMKWREIPESTPAEAIDRSMHPALEPLGKDVWGDEKTIVQNRPGRDFSTSDAPSSNGWRGGGASAIGQRRTMGLPADEGSPVSEQGDDWEEKTVIQSVANPGAPPSRQAAQDAEHAPGEDWDEKTIIQKTIPVDSEPEYPSPSEAPLEDEWGDKTVIQNLNNPPTSPQAPPSPESSVDDDWDDIPKTAIFRPDRKEEE